jgi:site-specific DNA-methyltransferase (adenine-specific)
MFQDSPNKNDIKKMVIQVKSGNVGVKDIKELITVKNKNDATIGVFISLQEPTEVMIKEALHEGFYVNSF